MTGEALATQTSLTVGFLHDFIRPILERRNAEPAQRNNELSARHAIHASCPLLRKNLQLVPFDGGGQPQLLGEILRSFAQRAEHVFGHLDGHLYHVCSYTEVPTLRLAPATYRT